MLLLVCLVANGRASLGGASDGRRVRPVPPQLLRARSYKLDLIWTAARAG